MVNIQAEYKIQSGSSTTVVGRGPTWSSSKSSNGNEGSIPVTVLMNYRIRVA
jgi:hypothetical protein